MWTKEQIKDHQKAVELLYGIKELVFDYLRSNKSASEYEVQQFILRKFEEYGLERDKDPPIVAFASSSDEPHYFAQKDSKKLEDNNLILIDLWARLKKEKSFFADITWMAYNGEIIPSDIQKIFDIVILARDSCLDFIKREIQNNKMPTGKEVDDIARNIIIHNGYGPEFKHNTGHSLGFISCHGEQGIIGLKNNEPLLKNLGYTIEPGIYLKGKFGVRSEIDFYISEDNNLIVTTDMQKEIVKL